MAPILPTLSGILTTLSGTHGGAGVRLRARIVSAKERQDLRKLGAGRTKKFDVLPDFEPKLVTTSGCQVCPQPFVNAAHPVAVCWRCGNCVFCGAYNDDRYGNYCFTCGNGDGRRFD